MMKKILVLTFLLSLCCGISYAQAKTWELTVSPEGRGPTGTTFKSVTEARDAIRKMRKEGKLQGAGRVTIHGGHYLLTEPLRFTAEDGTEEGVVHYVAHPMGKPLFSAGEKITGWTAGENGIWQTKLPEVAAGKWYFEQLFIGGRRAKRATLRGEEDKLFIAKPEDVRQDKPVPNAKASGVLQYLKISDSLLAKLAKLSEEELADTYFLIHHKWNSTRRHILRLDKEKKELVFRGKPYSSWAGWQKGIYQLENFKDALDEPGEWFLARDGMLYYKPLPGEKLTTFEAIAPKHCEELLLLRGEPGKPVKNISLTGLTFNYSKVSVPRGGDGPSQAANYLSAAVILDHAENIVLRDCEFSHLGRYGVWFRAGVQNCTLANSRVSDTGGGGVRIGETARINIDKKTTRADYQPALTKNNTVHNCIIRDGGKLYPDAVGVLVGHSGGNKVLHNDISNFAYSGVSVGWVWGYGKSLAIKNSVEFNRIHHIGDGRLSDMGGVYLLSPTQGTRVCNNVIHDVISKTYGGWGLYTDEGSSDVLMENNLVYRCKSSNFHQHYGKDNVIRNNILAFGKEYQLQATRVEQHTSFTFENNIVLFTTPSELLPKGRWEKLNIKMNKNCYWRMTADGKPSPFTFGGKTFEQWQKLGRDADSILADPLFVAPLKDDFRLQENSPVKKIGFKPFDYSRAGLEKE